MALQGKGYLALHVRGYAEAVKAAAAMAVALVRGSV